MSDENNENKPQDEKPKGSAEFNYTMGEINFVVEKLMKLTEDKILPPEESMRMLACVTILASLACLAPEGTISLAAVQAASVVRSLVQKDDATKGVNAPSTRTVQ